jgi:SAM-dependent methyltransferase
VRIITRHQISMFPVLGMLIRQARKIIAQYQFQKEFSEFKSRSLSDRFLVRWEDRRPCLNDKTKVTGFDRHYVYHPAWAARIIKKINPKEHVDIGSSLFFISVISAFVPVRFYDYRPAELHLDGLEFVASDLTCLQFEDKSIDSLSCMHVVEHIGLGRYGDHLDPEGDIKAMRELQRVLKLGGSLLFVVPVGVPRIMFNAHRIYGYNQIIETFDQLTLLEFSLIQELGREGPIAGATAEQVVAERYGCGCFWFQRKEAV